MEVNILPHAPAALHMWKDHQEPIKQEAGWAPQPVWMSRKRDETLASAGIRTAFRPAHNLGTILSELFRLPLAHLYDKK
jgi:hypothetical protein